MRAVVYRGVNDMRVETVPVPAIGPGELLVKVATCGICGTDLKKIHTGSHSAPRIFGHEMAGVIVAAGEGVTQYEVGERVMVFHHVPCDECYYCRKGTPAQCPLYKKVGVTAGFEPSGGGFAEYIRVMDFVVNYGGVVRIPDGVPFEQAAFVEPVNTVLKGVKMLNLAPMILSSSSARAPSASCMPCLPAASARVCSPLTSILSAMPSPRATASPIQSTPALRMSSSAFWPRPRAAAPTP